jgi:uncharacterized protein (TIGR00297 family)
MLLQLLMALALAAIISLAANRAHSLTVRGAIAATILGAIVFGLGGWKWATLLLAFFVLSSALTKAFGRSKEGLSEKYAKGAERDAGQVLSNGGMAGLFVLMHALFPAEAWPWIGYAGSLAAVNADTWATELGVLDPKGPRLITSPGRVVEKGTSGGVTLAGTASSVLGAFLIGFASAVLYPLPFWKILLAVTFAGFSGSLIDSFLGATLQAMYLCTVEKKETEKHPMHTCGAPTILIRGWAWLNNDLVNVACGVTGGLTALFLAAMARIV